jgi:hypothetical protein
MNINNNPRFSRTEDTDQRLIELIGPSNEIVTVTRNSKVDRINSTIDKYLSDNPDIGSFQAGRVWLLVGSIKGERQALNVGQSLDIFDEIKKDIGQILIQEKGPYYELFKSFDSFSFYEIKIDDYLKNHSPIKVNALKDLAYEFAKEYFAEVLIAHDTAAAHWDFFGSGMDKRFLFYLEDMDSDKYSFEKTRRTTN